MDIRVVLLLFILALARSYSSSARVLTPGPFPIHNSIVSVLKTIHHRPDREFEIEEGTGMHGRVCMLCEEYTAKALDFIAKNKTQTEIISILHKTCSRVLSFKQQCITLVDYYAPVFFLEVSSVQPEAFCQKVGLCQQVVSIYWHFSRNSCSFCHHVVTEALLKLKDPDTQLDIVQYLLKACDAVKGYTKKCKRLVFEYAPVILVNAEEFLEKNDICTMLHACHQAANGIEQMLGSETLSHSAS